MSTKIWKFLDKLEERRSSREVAEELHWFLFIASTQPCMDGDDSPAIGSSNLWDLIDARITQLERELEAAMLEEACIVPVETTIKSFRAP